MDNNCAVELRHITKRFGKVVANDSIDLTINRGEILSLLGENGSGKTTLMNMLAGIYFPDEGEIYVNGVLTSIRSPKDAFDNHIGMIHQHYKLVDVFTAAENIVLGLDEPGKLDIKAANARVKEICDRYGFDIDPTKKIYDMSVSQKQTVEIVKVLYRGADTLILDEPTNHLDMPSKDVLKEAIRNFDGTAIIVSHDREFLDGLVSKVYEFGGSKVKEHLGGIYDYLQAHNAESIEQVQLSAQTNKATANTANTAKEECTTTSAKQSYAEHKEQQKRIRKIERAVDEAEKEIERLENKLKEMDEKLCLPEHATDMALINEYTETKAALDKMVDQWETLSEELEEAKG